MPDFHIGGFMIDAGNAYKAYKKLAGRPLSQVSDRELNVIYNALCRARRDTAYREALDVITPEGSSVRELIENYLDTYSRARGYDVHERLSELYDERYAAGLYFTVESFVKDEYGERTPVSPVELLVGDEVTVVATLYSYEDYRPIAAPVLSFSWISDDGSSGRGRVESASTVEINLTADTAGSLNFRVFALDRAGKEIATAESVFGGLLFSADDITPAHTPPYDLYDFWDKEIARLMRVDPTDKNADGYTGAVAYDFEIPSKNRFSLRTVDSAYLRKMRENGLPTLSETSLEKYDVYELYLKSPGPAPTTAYVSVPKGRSTHSLPIRITYDSYDAHSPTPIISANQISVHCTHHGYEPGMPEEDYYSRLNNGVLKDYGKSNGGINSGYRDPSDCYMTYLIARDLQLIRFLADPSYSSVIPELNRIWTRELVLSGMSMGGYQALCVGALSTRLSGLVPAFSVSQIEANIPGFCNMAAAKTGKIASDFFSYEVGADYFDPVHLAPMIRAEVKLMRVGLGDETCIASGIQAVLNSLGKGVKRSANYLQNSSHGYLPEPKNQRWYRLEY